MRTPWLSTGFILATLTLVTPSARADMLPPNHKGVKLSVQVELEGDMPAGKALVLANTFQGADLLSPGEVAPFNWHPLGGELQLRLIDDARVAQLGPLRENLDRDAITALLRPDLACGPAFPGVRTVRESTSAEEVRWTLKVRASADACSGEVLRMDYLNAEGEPVATPDGAPPGTPLEPKTEPEPELKTVGGAEGDELPSPSATQAEPEKSAASGGCGCTTNSDAPLGLGLVGLLLGAGRWRRR